MLLYNYHFVNPVFTIQQFIHIIPIFLHRNNEKNRLNQTISPPRSQIHNPSPVIHPLPSMLQSHWIQNSHASR